MFYRLTLIELNGFFSLSRYNVFPCQLVLRMPVDYEMGVRGQDDLVELGIDDSLADQLGEAALDVGAGAVQHCLIHKALAVVEVDGAGNDHRRLDPRSFG